MRSNSEGEDDDECSVGAVGDGVGQSATFRAALCRGLWLPFDIVDYVGVRMSSGCQVCLERFA